jgi:hypothetical protein
MSCLMARCRIFYRQGCELTITCCYSNMLGLLYAPFYDCLIINGQAWFVMELQAPGCLRLAQECSLKSFRLFSWPQPFLSIEQKNLARRDRTLASLRRIVCLSERESCYIFLGHRASKSTTSCSNIIPFPIVPGQRSYMVCIV